MEILHGGQFCKLKFQETPLSPADITFSQPEFSTFYEDRERMDDRQSEEDL